MTIERHSESAVRVDDYAEAVPTDALFGIGQVIRHKLFGYRGVVASIDPRFQGTDEWYNVTARSRPPKNEPWYHVLVDESEHSTYVAECNMEADPSGEPIRNASVNRQFTEFRDGKYVVIRAVN